MYNYIIICCWLRYDLQYFNMNEISSPNIQTGLYVFRVRAVLVWGVTCTIRP